MRANVDEQAKQTIADLNQNLTQLQKHFGKNKIYFCSEQGQSQALADRIFREINIQNKGHDIAAGGR